MKKRNINYIVVHCTATLQNTTIESILNYWKTHLGWKTPGYHYIIRADGAIVPMHPEHLISNGVKGHNAESINISYIGGVDAKNNPVDNRTEAQKKSMLSLLQELKQKYSEAKIQGHRDFGVNKACPCFDAIEEYKHIKKKSV